MAHFAKINSNNEVLTVNVVGNENLHDANGVEVESVGQAYLEKHNNWPAAMWIQTSYNTSGGTHKNGGTPLRGNYAGIGYTWDSENNIFWTIKPYASWVKHIASASWKSPIGDAPELTAQNITDGAFYIWDESNQSWDLAGPLQE
jgi:hypothetical protein|tara:strand:- start:1279 stop:1713 length:435 start_codon:yes stop_codon:yes gene_type:complete